jgi:hypothetical protein
MSDMEPGLQGSNSFIENDFVQPPKKWDHIIIELVPEACGEERAQNVAEWLARNVTSVKLAAPAMVHEGSLIPKGQAVRGVNAG